MYCSLKYWVWIFNRNINCFEHRDYSVYRISEIYIFFKNIPTCIMSAFSRCNYKMQLPRVDCIITGRHFIRKIKKKKKIYLLRESHYWFVRYAAFYSMLSFYQNSKCTPNKQEYIGGGKSTFFMHENMTNIKTKRRCREVRSCCCRPVWEKVAGRWHCVARKPNLRTPPSSLNRFCRRLCAGTIFGARRFFSFRQSYIICIAL